MTCRTDGGSTLSTDEEPVLEAERDGVAWITLNRPAVLNAMNPELMDSLVGALTRAAESPSARCVVLAGAGRAFCVGGDDADIRARQEQAAKTTSIGALIEHQSRVMMLRVQSTVLLHTMPKPTIAVIQGYAVGGGLSLALAADFRLAASDAQLRAVFAQRALSGGFGINYHLTHTVGSAKARELMILDPVITGEEALVMGMVTAVHPPDELEGAAEAMARRLADGPTIAFGRVKDNINAAETMSLDSVMRLEAMNLRVTANTADAKEASAAFKEHREPRFEGR